MPNPGPVPMALYAHWKGVDDPPGQQVHVDREKLRKLAARLEHHLKELASTKIDPAPADAYGKWDAARAFYPSVQAGHDALVEQHRRVLHAMLTTVHKLRKTAQIHDEVEAALEHRIAGIDRAALDHRMEA